MPEKISSNVSGKQETVTETPAAISLAIRAGLFMLFLAYSQGIFLLGAKHYQLFPTNGNIIYVGSLSAVFLLVARLVTDALLPTVTPIIATALWCVLFTGVAIWLIRQEEF
jgi:hypothetical protein